MCCSAAQRPVPTPAQAGAAGSSLVAPPPARPPFRTTATSITLDLLRTQGLAGLYRGAWATLFRSACSPAACLSVRLPAC